MVPWGHSSEFPANLAVFCHSLSLVLLISNSPTNANVPIPVSEALDTGLRQSGALDCMPPPSLFLTFPPVGIGSLIDVAASSL